MSASPNIARIGTLLGDNTRARMLSALMNGKALTASELAREAGVTAQTATSHLNKLMGGGLLQLRKQGRHKYFALANEEVATLLEKLMVLSASEDAVTGKSIRIRTGPRDEAMRNARVCYNHLAGVKGIQLHDSLISMRVIRHKDGEVVLTRKGREFMISHLKIDVDALTSSRTPLCRSCLDWSERRSHLAGSLGRAMYARFEQLQWVKRKKNSRVVTFTGKGEREFNAMFKV